MDNLNQTVQETASTAEESASASQELSSQADSLLSLVSELRQIVIGSTHSTSHVMDHKENNSGKAQVLQFKQDSAKKLHHAKGTADTGSAFKVAANDPWEGL